MALTALIGAGCAEFGNELYGYAKRNKNKLIDGAVEAAWSGLSAGDSADVKTIVSKHPNGVVANINYMRGQELLHAIGYHSNGKKLNETYYKDGKPDKTSMWSVDGILNFEAEYDSSGKLAHYTAYYPTGKTHHEIFMQNSKLHGRATYWHANGKLLRVADYRNGKCEGVATTWHENGVKASESTFLAGVLHGPYKAWDEKGVLTHDCLYENGNELNGCGIEQAK